MKGYFRLRGGGFFPPFSSFPIAFPADFAPSPIFFPTSTVPFTIPFPVALSALRDCFFSHSPTPFHSTFALISTTKS